MLLMNDKDKVELICPKCNSEELERVMSATHYAMGAAGGGMKSQTRTCPSGSCTTYEVPGPAS